VNSLEKRDSLSVCAITRTVAKSLRCAGRESRPLLPRYGALGKAYMSLVEHYTDSELKLIFDYMEKMSQMNERLRAKALAAQRNECGVLLYSPG